MDEADPMTAQTESTASGSVPINTQAPGIVLQSLAFIYKAGQGLDPDNRIRKPFQQMGYTIYRDYDAPRNRMVSDYVKDKQIWYSMSHGGTEGGTPHGDKDSQPPIDQVRLINNDGFAVTSKAAISDGALVNIPSCKDVFDLTTKETQEGPYILGKDMDGTTILWCYNGVI